MSNHSKIAASFADAYFTSVESASFCRGILKERGWVSNNTTTIEPAVGSGRLVEELPGEVLAYDLIDHGFPGVQVGDFLEAAPVHADLVFSNPPFGRNCSLASKFVNKAALCSDRLAFIIPKAFRKVSIIDRLDPYLHLVGDYDLPSEYYDLPDSSTRHVKTCFQLWERRDYKRVRLGSVVKDPLYVKAEPEVADFAFRTQGSGAGDVLSSMCNKDGSRFSSGTTCYLKGDKSVIGSYNWKTIASYTSAIPALGMQDVNLGFFIEQNGGDMERYLKEGAPYYFDFAEEDKTTNLLSFFSD